MLGLGFHLLQRARDSNPRYRKVQQFSRLPRSTTPPALCIKQNAKIAVLSTSTRQLRKKSNVPLTLGDFACL